MLRSLSSARNINGAWEAHGRRYLRARTEISPDKDGDIPPQCRVTGRQDKAYIDLNSANGYRVGKVKAIK